MASPDRAIAAAMPAATNLRLLVRFFSRPANLLLAAAVLLVLWLVLVPLVALFYTSFTEQTMFGSGGFTPPQLLHAFQGRPYLLPPCHPAVYPTPAAAPTF